MNRVLTIGSAVLGTFFLYHTITNHIPETWDDKTNQIIKQLHPKIRREVAKIINSLHKRGINVRIISGLRSFSKQNAIYAQGRTTPGPIVTHAKGGQSYHNYGLAIDTIYSPKNMHEIVQEFKKHGYEWGGDFQNIDDPGHFQKRFGYSWHDFLNRNKYIKGTSYPIF